MPARIEYTTGQRFVGTKLVYLRDVAKTNPKERRALFLCDCGNTHEANVAWVRHLNTTSCGCTRVAVTTAKNLKHGQAVRSSKTGAYRSWQAMHQRCESHPNYAGIRFICDRWCGENGFANFYADMGPRPHGLTLDRINNSGHYEPTNCRWATYAEQNRNH